jgi:hypothetical protein
VHLVRHLGVRTGNAPVAASTASLVHLELPGPSFVIGLVWGFLCGWYVAVVFVPLFNFFSTRRKRIKMPNGQEKIMKSMTKATLLLAATSTLALAQSPADHEAHHPQQSAPPAAAQPAQPQIQQGMRPSQGMMGGSGMMNMMSGNMMQMMGSRLCGMGGMGTIDRVEGRIAFLRTELKITDTQSPAWNAFADTLRTNAKSLGEVRASMSQAGIAPQSLVDRLTLQEKWLAARLEGTRAMKSALTNLAGTLSDDQKKTADQLLAPHMGMNAMMCAMQSGRMGGQMLPGMMMQGQGP